MQDQPIPGFIVTLPNLITLLRLVLVPTIVWLITINEPLPAFWLFALAGAGDALDGFLARQFDLRSQLGALLDPLADKVLLVSLYVVLTILGEMPTWLAYLVVSRDVLIVGAVVISWLVDRPLEMKPLAVSKFNTAAQVVLAGVILADLAFAIDLMGLRLALVAMVGLLTVASAVAYFANWVGYMNRF